MRAVFVVLLLVLSVVACDEADPGSGYLIITGESAGDTFEIDRNESFEIRLPCNPSTGFSWAAVPAPGLEVGSPEFIADASNLVGVPGYERFEVTASQPGSIHVVFEYTRPWEDVAPEQVFEFDLLVD